MIRTYQLMTAAALGFAVSTACTVSNAPGAVPMTPAGHAVNRPSVSVCHKPAPTSADGYAAMFAALPVSEWGAADVAISVPLGRRSVWLFGDTLSTRRFVHSTAIIQDKGCLHVSHAGAQLLPDDDPAHIYWIISARAVDSTSLAVLARAITLVGKGAWDFRDGGHSRTAHVDVDAQGDASFIRWVSDKNCAAPDPGAMYRIDDRPHHFGYARNTHPEAHLASGRTLVTTCQNWDDGMPHPFADYRPIFTE